MYLGSISLFHVYQRERCSLLVHVAVRGDWEGEVTAPGGGGGAVTPPVLVRKRSCIACRKLRQTAVLLVEGVFCDEVMTVMYNRVHVTFATRFG